MFLLGGFINPYRKLSGYLFNHPDFAKRGGRCKIKRQKCR